MEESERSIDRKEKRLPSFLGKKLRVCVIIAKHAAWLPCGHPTPTGTSARSRDCGDWWQTSSLLLFAITVLVASKDLQAPVSSNEKSTRVRCVLAMVSGGMVTRSGTRWQRKRSHCSNAWRCGARICWPWKVMVVHSKRTRRGSTPPQHCNGARCSSRLRSGRRTLRARTQALKAIST